MAVSDLKSTTTTYFYIKGGSKHKKRFFHPIFSFFVAFYSGMYAGLGNISPHPWTFLKSYHSFKNGESLLHAARDARIFAKGVYFHGESDSMRSSTFFYAFLFEREIVTMVPNVQKTM